MSNSSRPSISSRRAAVLAIFGGALTAGSAWRSEAQRVSPEARPSPNTPNPDHPWGLAGRGDKPEETKSVARQNQAEVKASVQKLYELATELKEQVDKSDANMVLSVAVVKKSQAIEKLAKHVKELAKG
jgi:hypothetical protein